MIKVFTAFSGYDSQCMALERLGVDYDLVGWSEIDRFAIRAHDAVFPQYEGRNYGDIAAIDWSQVPDFDLFTYSSPCQDFSQAGLQKGGERRSGTRSSLLWECERAIVAKRPKYLIMENVAALVGSKFIQLFNSWQRVLEGYGYTNFARVLNARNYGVPQNRERIFMVSVRDCDRCYHFPKPVKLERRLKDVLERDVDKKYYLSDKFLAGMLKHTERHKSKDNEFLFAPKDGLDVAGTISTLAGSRPTDNFIKEPVVLGWTRDEKGEVTDRHPVDVANCVTSSKRDNTQNYVAETVIGALRGRCDGEWHGGEHYQHLYVRADGVTNTLTQVDKDDLVLETKIGVAVNPSRKLEFGGFSDGVCPTLRATDYKCPHCVTDYVRIRRLTERECLRLMDVTDADIDKIQAAGISRSQQYKMAGNSIVVAVLAAIFDRLLVNTDPEADTQLEIY